jgi:hypothetical protein
MYTLIYHYSLIFLVVGAYHIPMLLDALTEACSSISNANLFQVMEFLQFFQLAKASIEWSVKDCSLPPAKLPFNIAIILSRVMGQELSTTQAYWLALKDYAWNVSVPESPASPSAIFRYNQAALDLGTCASSISLWSLNLLKVSSLPPSFPPH